MVRTYRRKKPKVEPSKLKDAVLSVRRDNFSIRSAARLHGVTKSTLCDWLKKTTEEQALEGRITIRTQGHKTIFTEAVETVLSEYLLKNNDIYYGLSKIQFRAFAYDLALKLELAVPESWERYSMAGADWLLRFLKRRPELSLDKFQNLEPIPSVLIERSDAVQNEMELENEDRGGDTASKKCKKRIVRDKGLTRPARTRSRKKQMSRRLEIDSEAEEYIRDMFFVCCDKESESEN